MGFQIRGQHVRRNPKTGAVRPQRRLETGKGCLKLKKESKDTFFSLAEACVMPAPSSKKAEKRPFVIDSGVSVHMLSEEDLSSGELETHPP